MGGLLAQGLRVRGGLPARGRGAALRGRAVVGDGPGAGVRARAPDAAVLVGCVRGAVSDERGGGGRGSLSAVRTWGGGSSAVRCHRREVGAAAIPRCVSSALRGASP